MKDSAFLDTNVLVYTFDQTAPEKRSRATQLVEQALVSGRGVISYQVVQEFLNVATRKFRAPLSPADCRVYLDRVLAPLCSVWPCIPLYHRAMELADRWRYSFYDALIIAAALEAGCPTLYSEDLQHGQTIGGLTIVNPFSTTT